MSTIKVTIRGDKELNRSLKKVSKTISNAKPILKRISDKLTKYFKDSMKSEGVKLLKKRWQKLTPETLSAKSRLGFGSKKILERTGKLRKGIKRVQLSNSKVTISNKVKYYKYHQVGGKTLPQRQMLGVNNDVADIAMKEIVKSIKF